MADNVQANSGSGGPVFATDDISSVHWPYSKAAWGPRDTANEVDDVSGKRLPIALPNGAFDTFGKLQVVNSINDIDVQFFRDDPANLVDVTMVSSGGAAKTTGFMQLTTTTTTNSQVTAVSRETVMYRSGGEVYAMFTAFWTTNAASTYQRIGLYDATNGFFIGYEGTTFGVTVRTGAADTQTAKASFNVDTLVGAAGSKFTRAGVAEAIDLTKMNVFRVRFGWLGAAPVKFEVMSPDGEWVLFHVVRQPNLVAGVSIQSADLPITADLKNSASTALTMGTACWGAGVTYDKVDVANSMSLATATNSVAEWVTQGIGTLSIRCGTSTTGTIIFEATVDGVNWITHPQCWLLSAVGVWDTQVTGAVTPTSGNTYRIQCTGFRGVRVRTASTLGATTVLHATGDKNVSVINVVSAPPITKDALRISVQSAGLTTATTAYTAGDTVGTQFTIANCARSTGGSGVITGVQLVSALDATGVYDVVFFDSSVTLASDNAAFSISAADTLKVVQLVNLSAAYDLGSGRIAQSGSIYIPYTCSGGTSLYAGLITRLGHTFFAATTALQLIVYVERFS